MNKKSCCLYPALSLTFLVALFFTLPFVLGLIFRDDDLVDTSALYLEPRVIADEENGYFDFENIIEEEVPVEVTDELELHLNGEKWDADFVESTLKDYARLIETVESAAEKPFFQDPRTSNPEEGDYLDGIPKIHIMNALRMNNLKAMSLMKEGKETEAFAQAYHSVTIGIQIEESYVTFIHYLIGNTAKQSGIETLALLIPEATDVELLKTYSQKLAEAYPSEENVIQAYTVEYHLMNSIFDLVDENPSELDPFMDNLLYGDLEEEFLYPVFKKIGWNFYYHPNETRNLYYELMSDRPTESGVLFPRTPIVYFTENAIGLALVEGLTPRLDIYEGERWNEELVLIETTQAEMDSRAYALGYEEIQP